MFGNTKKGQMTIVLLLSTVITIFLYSAIYPILDQAISTALSYNPDPATAIMLKLIPFFLLLFIVLGVLWYVIPHREEVYYGR